MKVFAIAWLVMIAVALVGSIGIFWRRNPAAARKFLIPAFIAAGVTIGGTMFVFITVTAISILFLDIHI